VIAEGIEHVDQLQALRDAECPFAQGFLFSRAVSRGEMDRLLERLYFSDEEFHGRALVPFVSPGANMPVRMEQSG
jgi:hypothetical protein